MFNVKQQNSNETNYFLVTKKNDFFIIDRFEDNLTLALMSNT